MPPAHGLRPRYPCFFHDVAYPWLAIWAAFSVACSMGPML